MTEERDIVERLRGIVYAFGITQDVIESRDAMIAAADEIERLRMFNAQLKEQLDEAPHPKDER